ncbi:Four-carbon acid sugar kinase family protein [Azospirillaceae bacterium]
MKIGIFAPSTSRQAQILRRELEAISSECVVFLDSELTERHQAAVGNGRVYWNDEPLDDIDGLYCHGFDYQDPVLPPADPLCDWGLWQIGPVIAQQRYSFLFSLLSRVESAGTPMINPLSILVSAFARYTLLDRVKRAGFAVPNLICTNDGAAVDAFTERFSTAVWRPVTGRAAWQLFRSKQRQHLIGVEKPPVMIAEVVPGPLVRVYVVDGVVTLAVAINPPVRAKVETLETFVPAPSKCVEQLAPVGAAMTALGVRFAMATVVLSEQGPVIYDIDPDPVLTDMPETFAVLVLRQLACALLRRPISVMPPDLEAETRPALLLRRMLGIQFDMEATKYAEAS